MLIYLVSLISAFGTDRDSTRIRYCLSSVLVCVYLISGVHVSPVLQQTFDNVTEASG